MDSIDLRNILSKLVAVVVMGVPFAFLGGLIWYVMPKQQTTEEIAENVETIDVAETMDSIMPYDGALDDELAPQYATNAGRRTVTGATAIALHRDPILHGLNYGDSVLIHRHVWNPTTSNRPKITIPDHNDFGKVFNGADKVERVAPNSVSHQQAQPSEQLDITPVDTVAGD